MSDVPQFPRLSKVMADRGLCSRREADTWIERGWVRVDGMVVRELGSRVDPVCAITLAPEARSAQARLATFLLHKPIGFVSGQAEQGYQPASTLVVAERRWAGDTTPRSFAPAQLAGLAPAGRLDIDSTGLLVLTQDGRIARTLIGDDSDIEKEYLVRVGGKLDAAGLQLLRHGLSLDGQPLRPAEVEWQNEDQLRFVLREGRKRQIRRMCEAVGLRVLGLKRVRIGAVLLGALPPGQWRYLGEQERFDGPRPASSRRSAQRGDGATRPGPTADRVARPGPAASAHPRGSAPVNPRRPGGQDSPRPRSQDGARRSRGPARPGSPVGPGKR